MHHGNQSLVFAYGLSFDPSCREAHSPAPKVLNCEFGADATNRMWVSDIRAHAEAWPISGVAGWHMYALAREAENFTA